MDKKLQARQKKAIKNIGSRTFISNRGNSGYKNILLTLGYIYRMQPTRTPLEQFMRDKLDKCNYIKLENIIESLGAGYGYMHGKIIEVTDSQWSEFYDKIVCERIPYKNIGDGEMCDFFGQNEETKLIIAKLLGYEE